VLVGHSTGGSLALGCLLNHGLAPAMTVLAATPARIEGDDLARWERHRRDQADVPLGDVARMVSYVNRIGRNLPSSATPLLVLSGGEDALVPTAHADIWRRRYGRGSVRSVTLAGAAHDLFTGTCGAAAADCIARAASRLGAPSPSDLRRAEAIGELEPGVGPFIEADPMRAFHLARSPAALRISDRPFDYPAVVPTDPLQLNVEITSRCNLSCSHCARSRLTRAGRDMDEGLFTCLLDLLPHTYKVVLVGLGEPTLHPRVAEFVAQAVGRGHDVSMVTNAMVLEKALSRRLIDAGLRAITFSLDGVDPALASLVRSGTDVERVRRNIADFIELAAGRIPAAVFSAVSAKTVEHLPELAAVISRLGLNAWMLSDLNFAANQGESVWKRWCTGYGQSIGQALKTAFGHGLPVLSVRGVETLGLAARYHDYLLTSPVELGRRSPSHRWCQSPWQSLPVDVGGNVTLCDCQPAAVVGNLARDGLSDIWNGRAMQAHRRKMRSKSPPEVCRICPRF
jgi:MoaA/NifB/PqqE/SkfB family radical SAM enzyme